MKTLDKVSFTDIDSEKELLGLLLNYPSFTKELQNIISPDIFHYTSNKAIYLACVELYSEKGKFTHADIILRLKSKGVNDWIEVMSLATVRTPMQANEIIYYLAELKGKRDLMALSKDINNSLILGQDYFSILQKVSDATDNNIIKNEQDEVTTMKDALSNAVEFIGDVMTNGSLSGVPTGYPKLDEITGGWLNGNVILFAARPGQGKTIALLEHARNAAMMNKKVLFLSLEMPVESLIYRMISGVLDNGIPYSKIKTGRISIEQYSDIQRQAVTDLEKLPIIWYDKANRDINYLSSMIQRIVKDKGIDIVMIDYLQLMSDNKINASNETAMVGSVADKIQQLAMQLNIPFVCAAQLNRASEGRGSHRPRLADLRSSGKIEQMASVVIGLYRADYYAYEQAKEDDNPNVEFNNIIEYIFLKNRDGDCRTLDLHIEVAHSKIRELSQYSTPSGF